MEDGRIFEVGGRLFRKRAVPAALWMFQRVDVRGKILFLPGFVNAHYHSQDNLIAGAGVSAPLKLSSLATTPMRMHYTSRDAFISTLIGTVELLSYRFAPVIDHVAAHLNRG